MTIETKRKWRNAAQMIYVLFLIIFYGGSFVLPPLVHFLFIGCGLYFIVKAMKKTDRKAFRLREEQLETQNLRQTIWAENYLTD